MIRSLFIPTLSLLSIAMSAPGANVLTNLNGVLRMVDTATGALSAPTAAYERGWPTMSASAVAGSEALVFVDPSGSPFVPENPSGTLYFSFEVSGLGSGAATLGGLRTRVAPPGSTSTIDSNNCAELDSQAFTLSGDGIFVGAVGFYVVSWASPAEAGYVSYAKLNDPTITRGGASAGLANATLRPLAFDTTPPSYHVFFCDADYNVLQESRGSAVAAGGTYTFSASRLSARADSLWAGSLPEPPDADHYFAGWRTLDGSEMPLAVGDVALIADFAAYDDGLEVADLDYTDAGATLSENPYRGGMSGANGSNWHLLDPAKGKGTVNPTAPSVSLMWKLTKYSKGNFYNANDMRGTNEVGGADIPIDAAGLAAIRTSLANARANGSTLLLRFAYDWNGYPGLEPADFETIITHIGQISEVLNEFPDVVNGLECGMIGVYGEMHTSPYTTSTHYKRVVDAWLGGLDPSIKLLVRSPAHIAHWTGESAQTLVANLPIDPVAHPGADRIGLYNDGYLGTEYDYGTWGGAGAASWTRAQGVDYLDTRRNVPYGGELATVSEEYAQAHSALLMDDWNMAEEFYRTHLSYLRGISASGTMTLIKLMKSLTFTEAAYSFAGMPDLSEYDGKDLRTLVEDHMGYRYLLRSSRLPPAAVAPGSTVDLALAIENTGFGDFLLTNRVDLLLSKDGAVYSAPLPLDLATDLPSPSNILHRFRVTLPGMLPAGTWSLHLRARAPLLDDRLCALSRRAVRFANAGGIYDSALCANAVGSLVVAGSSSDTNAVFAAQGAAAGTPTPIVELALTSSPVAVTVPEGAPILLAARLEGATNVRYVFGGTEIPATADGTARIDAATAADAGTYGVRCTDASGNAVERDFLVVTVATASTDTAPTLGTPRAESVTADSATIVVPIDALGEGNQSVTISVALGDETRSGTVTVDGGSVSLAFSGLASATRHAATIVAKGENGLEATADVTFTTAKAAGEWFTVELGSGAYTNWPAADAGGSWSGAVESASLSGSLVTFSAPLRYMPDPASESGTNIVVSGSLVVAPYAEPPVSEETPLGGICFVGSGTPEPRVFAADGWMAAECGTSAAVGAEVGYAAIFDFASDAAPRVRYVLGGTTNRWHSITASATGLSAVAFVGAGSFGSFRGRYCELVATIELPTNVLFTAGGAGFSVTPSGDAASIQFQIASPEAGVYYTPFVCDRLDGGDTDYVAATNSVPAVTDQALTIGPFSSADDALFIKIVATLEPVDEDETLSAVKAK